MTGKLCSKQRSDQETTEQKKNADAEAAGNNAPKTGVREENEKE
jgi:hypothetical protein